ncbi:MAG: AmmeMemoRadiSam system protein B [Promethearchaeota archaeon]
MSVRKAFLAGSWYPGNSGNLVKTIEACFTSRFGPRYLPGKSNEAGSVGSGVVSVPVSRKAGGVRRVIGIISPHAGYAYSGGVAAHGYSMIARDGLPDAIILIGSHGGFNDIYIQTDGAWESPLGITRIDEELSSEIASNSSAIEINNRFFLYTNDNTFELQLPFIQYLSNEIRLVPIAVGTRNPSKLKEAARDLSGTLKPYFDSESEGGKKIVIVASTDLTHYGKINFGFAPADGKPVEVQNEWVKKNDLKVLNDICNFQNKDTADILQDSLKNKNICCPGAIMLALETIKQLRDECDNLNKLDARILMQATSHDIEPRSHGVFSAVGYASILFST